MAEPEVRLATQADAAAMARVRVASWRSTYRGMVADEVLDGFDLGNETLRFATRIGTAPGTLQLVAVDADGALVGYCMCGPDRDHEDAGVGEVYAIYVHPDAQGSGHGSQLMAAAVGWLRERGYGELHVWALTANEVAAGFYQRRGWTRDGAERALDGLPDTRGEPVRESRFTLVLDQEDG